MSHFKKRLQLFAKPSFCWYVTSCFLATFGGGLSYITIVWLVLHNSHSVSAVAMLMICFWLPGVLLGPVMGVLVDRIPARHHLLAASNALRAIALLLFGYSVYHTHTLTGLYILGSVLGLFFSLYMPAATRLVREMVPEEDLLYANATIDMMYEVGNVAGMGFAGLLISWVHASGAIIINGILLLLAALMMLFIRRKDLKIYVNSTASLNIVADFTSGIRYLRSDRSLVILYTLELLLFLEYLTAPVLLAPFATHVLHANVTQFGHIEAWLSIGAVAGGILIPWLADQYGMMRTLVWATISLGTSYLLFSFNHYLPLAEILYFILGVAFGVWPLIMTQAQKMTAVQYQGRLQSVFSSLSGICLLLIYLGVTLLGDRIAIQKWYGLELLLTLSTLWLIWHYHHTCNKIED